MAAPRAQTEARTPVCTIHHTLSCCPGGLGNRQEVVRPRVAPAPWEAPRLAGQQSREEPGVHCWHGHMQVTGFQLACHRDPAGKGQRVLLPWSLDQHFVSRWRPFSEVRHSQRGMGLIHRGGPADTRSPWHYSPAHQVQGSNGSVTPHVLEAAGCPTQVYYPSLCSETGGRWWWSHI